MKKEKSLETLLVLVGALIVLFWFLDRRIFLLVALALVLTGIFSPYLTNFFSRVWLKFSELIGSIMSKIILSLIFFAFLLPLAIFRKIFKKDSMLLGKKKNSYYIDRDHTYSGRDLENMW